MCERPRSPQASGHPALCDPSWPPSEAMGWKLDRCFRLLGLRRRRNLLRSQERSDPYVPKAQSLRGPREPQPASSLHGEGRGRPGVCDAALLKPLDGGSAPLPPQRLRGEWAGLATLSHHPVALYPGHSAPPGNHKPGLPRECRPPDFYF